MRSAGVRRGLDNAGVFCPSRHRKKSNRVDHSRTLTGQQAVIQQHSQFAHTHTHTHTHTRTHAHAQRPGYDSQPTTDGHEGNAPVEEVNAGRRLHALVDERSERHHVVDQQTNQRLHGHRTGVTRPWHFPFSTTRQRGRLKTTSNRLIQCCLVARHSHTNKPSLSP